MTALVQFVGETAVQAGVGIKVVLLDCGQLIGKIGDQIARSNGCLDVHRRVLKALIKNLAQISGLGSQWCTCWG